MTDERMSDADYLQTQHQVMLFVGLLKDLDLRGFRRRLDQADTLGAILDPTLYREALQSGKLSLLLDTTEALQVAQSKINLAETRFKERQR